MDQLSLFDFPDEPAILRAPIAVISQNKWDAWWLELLCRPRDEWDDPDDGAEPSDLRIPARQEMLPGVS